jgi:hypothetical protein
LSKKFIKAVDGKSCAVVGNSNNLIGSGYGSFIDSHDIVFRMNVAPVEKQYAQDIGYKTNIRFINVKWVDPRNKNLNFFSENGNEFYMIGSEHPELNKSFSKNYDQYEPHNPDKQERLIHELAKEKQINLYMGNAETK